MTKGQGNRAVGGDGTRGGRARRRGIAVFGGLEQLEPRQLLSADLTGAFSGLSGTAPAGSASTITITLQNLGDQDARGSLTIDLFAMPDGQEFDPDQAVTVGHFKGKGTLPANDAVNVDIPTTVPASTQPGDYRLVAVIDPQNNFADDNRSNNTIQSDVVDVVAPDYDLVPGFGSKTKLPASIVVGQKAAKGSVQVTITNPIDSTQTLPAKVTVGVQVVLRPHDAVDDSQDVVISKDPQFAKLATLGPGKSASVSVAVTVPGNLDADDYDVVAKIDTTSALTESNESNNEAMLDGPGITVEQATTDFTLTISPKIKLPATAISDGQTTITLPVVVGNAGNTASDRAQTASITVRARPVGGGDDVIVAIVHDVKLGGLKPGARKNLKVAAALPVGMDSGDYHLVASVNPGEVDGDDAGNNTASTEDLDLAPIAIATGFNDLEVGISSSTLASALIAGNAASGTVRLGITNNGNIALPKTQHVGVAVVLRPNDAIDDSQDVPIGTAANASIGKLRPGALKQISVKIAVPADAPADDYTMLAIVTPVESLSEQSTENNTAEGGQVTIAPAFVDLQFTAADTDFAATVTGDSAGLGRVTIKNGGNTPAKGSATVEFFATDSGEIDGSAVSLGSITTTLNLAAGQSVSIAKIPLVMANVEEAASKQIVAKVTPVSGFTDTHAENDVTPVSTNTINPAPPSPADLLGTMTITSSTVDLSRATSFGTTASSHGTWTSSTGRTGAYLNWQVFYQGTADAKKTPIFQITFGTGPTLPTEIGFGITNFFMVFDSAGNIPETLAGKTITFTKTKQPNSLGHVGDLAAGHSAYAGGLTEVPLAYFSIS